MGGAEVLAEYMISCRAMGSRRMSSALQEGRVGEIPLSARVRTSRVVRAFVGFLSPEAVRSRKGSSVGEGSLCWLFSNIPGTESRRRFMLTLARTGESRQRQAEPMERFDRTLPASAKGSLIMRGQILEPATYAEQDYRDRAPGVEGESSASSGRPRTRKSNMIITTMRPMACRIDPRKRMNW